MRYRVKHSSVLLYGFVNKVCITLNVGQVWQYKSEPSKYFQFHRLTRKNVVIEITNEDFESIFEPYEKEKEK